MKSHYDKQQSLYHFSQILINKKSLNFLIFAEIKKNQLLQNFLKKIVDCTQYYENPYGKTQKETFWL